MTQLKEVTKKNLDEVIKKNMDQLGYLKDRWQDEKEYEDFAEYKEAVTKLFVEKYKDIKVTKGFKINAIDLETSHKIEIRVGLSSFRAGIYVPQEAR